MDNVLNHIKLFIAVVGSCVGALLGGADGLLYTLLGFVAADYVTGVFCAIFVSKDLSSEIGFKGILKKIMIFTLVGVAHAIDANVLGSAPVIRVAVISFYLANEGISITENAARLGLPLPKKLVEILKQLKSKSESEDNNNG